MIDKDYSFPQLPVGWVWTKLGEISCLNAGNPAPQGEEYFDNGTYPFVRVQDMGNLGNSVYIHYTKDYLNSKAIEKMRIFPKGSVSFTKSGMSILLNQRAILGKDMYIVSHIGIAEPLGGVPGEWLYYWLKTVDFKDLTHATTLPSLQLTKVKEISLPLPPLLEQHRIVAKIEELFTKLDSGIDALNKIKLQLKQYRQAVLKHAFVGKLVKEWREAHKGEMEPASVLLERIKEERRKNTKGKFKELPPLDASDLPELPDGWVWTTVGTLFDVSIGGTPSRRKSEYWNGHIHWASSGEVANCRIVNTREHITELGLQNSNAKLLPEGTVLLAMIGEGKTRGQAALLNVPAATNQNIASILCADSVIPGEYIFLWFLARYKETRAEGSGDMQPALNSERVKRLTVPLCPFPEQHRIVEEIEQRFSVADEIEKVVGQSLMHAERLRQSILKRAFEGKLVPQDPNDEPAQKLLERIKAEKVKREAEKKAAGRGRKRLNTIQGSLM